jgi:NAD(P)H-flavin reductase
VNSFTSPIRFGKNASHESFTLLHRSSVDERPTAIELVMKRPEGFHFTAGQYIFIKVPSIDSVWHAFSLGSCPADEAIHLHMGVIGGQRGNWIDPTEDDPDFRQKNPTWTYKLFASVRDRVKGGGAYEPIRAVVRGPYGSPFQSCFTRKFKACVLVGSGTGLTSALSILKEVMERRRMGEATSDKVWFVWTCRNVRDLRWCWRTLQQAVVEACRTGAIDVPEGWSAATSASLGWLGVSVFVSQANKTDLLSFLGYSDESNEVVPDEFDYHDADKLPTGPPPGHPAGAKGHPAHTSIRLPKANALDGLGAPWVAPPRFESEDDFSLPPTPASAGKSEVTFFNADAENSGESSLSGAPALPPKHKKKNARKTSFVTDNPFVVKDNEASDASDDDGDYIPPPRPPKRVHGAASDALPMRAEMALLRKKSTRHPPTDKESDESFWSSAPTIDFSTQMYGNDSPAKSSNANSDSAAADQLNEKFEAGFKLRMPTMSPRKKRAAPPPPMAEKARRWRSTKKDREKKRNAPPPPPPEVDDDDAVEQEDYYVVSTTVRAANARALKAKAHPEAITMDGIYVSSQQRDVLHTCPNDVKTVLKRAATRKAGGHAHLGQEAAPHGSEIESLVSMFLAAGGTGNRRAEEELLVNLLERSKGRQRLDIGSWLKEQVIATSMDTKGAHIRDLLHDLQLTDDYEHMGPPRRVAVCYCGPNGLAQSLGAVAREMNITFEYLAHAD